ncbi:MAG TPA: hypothetical protein VIN67_09860 [Desulfobaccales bacterium]
MHKNNRKGIPMKRYILFLLITCVILACGQKSDLTIVGKWELDKKGVILHFLSDETFIVEKTPPGKKEKLLGTYKLIDGKYIKTVLSKRMDSDEQFREERDILEINSLTNDKLVVKVPDDQLLTFYRLK